MFLSENLQGAKPSVATSLKGQAEARSLQLLVQNNTWKEPKGFSCVHAHSGGQNDSVQQEKDSLIVLAASCSKKVNFML